MTISSETETSRVVAGVAPAQLAQDESFWQDVRSKYVLPEDFTLLEYGWYHPCARSVLETEIAALKRGHAQGSRYKRGAMKEDRNAARADLASLAGVTRDEILITRNSTDAINLVVDGFSLDRGDAIVCCDQEYPNMMTALNRRAARERLNVNVARLPLDPQSDDEVVEAYAAAITPRARAIVITHVINHTGHVLPLQRLCALGRQRNLQIFVDAAHSFAQLDFKVSDIDCDYLCSSLHKWLGAPLGTGMLYIRRGSNAGLEQWLADSSLEHTGNGPDQNLFGLREALRWHNELGGAPVKAARLHFLQRRWTEVARTLPGVRLLTPRDPARHGAIGVVAVEGISPVEVARRLMDDHRIFTNAVNHPVVQGVRVTPGVPTSTAEIDHLVHALQAIASR